MCNTKAGKYGKDTSMLFINKGDTRLESYKKAYTIHDIPKVFQVSSITNTILLLCFLLPWVPPVRRWGGEESVEVLVLFEQLVTWHGTICLIWLNRVEQLVASRPHPFVHHLLLCLLLATNGSKWIKLTTKLFIL